MDFYNPDPLPEEIPSLTSRVPPHTLKGLRQYVHFHRPVGHFLTAVLANNLGSAVGRADAENATALADIVKFVHNCIPAPCHGSPEAVDRWLDERAAVVANAQ